MAFLSRVWLKHDVLASLIDEANRAAPTETGGVLLGYVGEPGGEPVVTHAIGPGPEAVHEIVRFVPDHDFQIAEIGRLYKESGARLQYLGDWHSHPGGACDLSEKDKRTLKQIAACKEARNKHPVMLILARGPTWDTAAWIGVWSRRILRRTLIIREIAVVPY